MKPQHVVLLLAFGGALVPACKCGGDKPTQPATEATTSATAASASASGAPSSSWPMVRQIQVRPGVNRPIHIPGLRPQPSASQ